MRKITASAISCFLNGIPFKSGNTEVQDFGSYTVLLLHGNKIAEMEYSGTGANFKKVLKITNAGWKSNVTKERLNGIPGVRISQVRGEWFLNGEKWDGKLIKV